MRYVALKLHQVLVCSGAAVRAQLGKRQACVLCHAQRTCVVLCRRESRVERLNAVAVYADDIPAERRPALLLTIQLHHVLRVAGNLQTIAVYHSAEVIKVVVCGRFMEAVANADTIVFDKTGTLTYATPRVAMIETFGDREESEISLPT